MVGEAASYNMLLQTCKNNIILPPNPEDVMLGSRGGSDAASGAGVADLPDDAIICSCESVSKAAICDAVIKDNCESIDTIKNARRQEQDAQVVYPW